MSSSLSDATGSAAVPLPVDVVNVLASVVRESAVLGFSAERVVPGSEKEKEDGLGVFSVKVPFVLAVVAKEASAAAADVLDARIVNVGKVDWLPEARLCRPKLPLLEAQLVADKEDAVVVVPADVPPMPSGSSRTKFIRRSFSSESSPLNNVLSVLAFTLSGCEKSNFNDLTSLTTSRWEVSRFVSEMVAGPGLLPE